MTKANKCGILYYIIFSCRANRVIVASHWSHLCVKLVSYYNPGLVLWLPRKMWLFGSAACSSLSSSLLSAIWLTRYKIKSETGTGSLRRRKAANAQQSSAKAQGLLVLMVQSITSTNDLLL